MFLASRVKRIREIEKLMFEENEPIKILNELEKEEDIILKEVFEYLFSINDDNLKNDFISYFNLFKNHPERNKNSRYSLGEYYKLLEEYEKKINLEKD